MKLNSLVGYIIFILFLLFLPVLGRCEDICIDKNVMSDITVDLEKSKILEKQYELLQFNNSELEKQIGLLNQIIELKDRQLQVENEALKNYSDLLKDQKKLYEEAIKQSKPSFFESISKGLGMISVGIIIGVLLI